MLQRQMLEEVVSSEKEHKQEGHKGVHGQRMDREVWSGRWTVRLAYAQLRCLVLEDGLAWGFQSSGGPSGFTRSNLGVEQAPL